MDDKLKEAFKRAADIASVAPESMQQAAFNRALDAILGTPEPVPSPPSKAQARRAPSQPTAPAAPEADHIAALSAMVRSQAPEVDKAEGAQKKALALLLVARRELDIDGLTSTEMATVLTEKFRWRVSRQAINQAMDTAGNRVDRVKTARGGSRYRIMEAGERYLAQPAQGGAASAAGTAGGTPRRRRKGKPATKSSTTAAAPATTTTTKKASGRGHAKGPKAAVETLIKAGWFATPRGLADIRKELEHRLALRFTPQDLSPTMTRLLRAGALTREKTATGQYEYHG